MQKREKPSMWSDVEGPIDDHIPGQAYHAGAANSITICAERRGLCK